MISVVCFKWAPRNSGKPRVAYGPEHVHRLANMLQRNLRLPHEVVCITDDARGLHGVRTVKLPPEVSALPINFPKLWAWSDEMRDAVGKRLLLLDLDCVMVGDITPLVDRPEDAVLWRAGTRKTRYNTSMVLADAGARTRVWRSFDLRKAMQAKKKRRMVGSDQMWVSLVLGEDEATWTRVDGVYKFRSIRQSGLPADARIVFFPGEEDPSRRDLQRSHPWIKEQWR